MEARLTDINENEALLYMGYKGGEIPPEVGADIAQCRERLLATARPRMVWRLFALQPDFTLAGTEFVPQGQDVKDLLSGCDSVIFLAATLGAEVESLLRKTQVRNMSQAVILDACASAAIENVCDNLCADLQEHFAPLYLTDRFSPGYGDMPFAQQPDFCRVLDVSRRIGVNLSPSGLMIPQKSVTALVGLSPVPTKKRHRGCAYCRLFKTCNYRKDNKTCGAF
jgi:hypothetical protein